MHVPKEQRSKLDYKATPCIFLGYGGEDFGYRLWDPYQKKFIRSRDVVFYADQTIGDSDKEAQPDGAVRGVDPLASDEESHDDILKQLPMKCLQNQIMLIKRSLIKMCQTMRLLIRGSLVKKSRFKENPIRRSL